MREAYLWFGLLSSDAADVTAPSLYRHLVREQEGDTVHLGARIIASAALPLCSPVARSCACCYLAAMPKDELIVQLLKIALGLALGAYFVWWSLEVLHRLPPH